VAEPGIDGAVACGGANGGRGDCRVIFQQG